VTLDGFKEPRLERAQDRFLATLTRETGIPFMPATATPRFVVHTNAANPLGADARPANLPATGSRITPMGFTVPAVTIDDKPRFPWRGLDDRLRPPLHPVPVIERNLDAMEAVKLNVFHWHLSDDQGFRVKAKLSAAAAKGLRRPVLHAGAIRHIVEYARDRGIRVVPEFDMPAHATAWFAGYPQLASGKGPYQIARQWGVLDPAMDPTRRAPTNSSTLLIGEMTGLFPDAYFHVGGDECNGKEWDANPRSRSSSRHNLKLTMRPCRPGSADACRSSSPAITRSWRAGMKSSSPIPPRM
jgi:hexosaminidase